MDRLCRSGAGSGVLSEGHVQNARSGGAGLVSNSEDGGIGLEAGRVRVSTGLRRLRLRARGTFIGGCTGFAGSGALAGRAVARAGFSRH